MKAVLQDRYGTVDDLRIGEADTPVLAADEVLVRVIATNVHADVWHVIAGRPYFMRIMGGGFRRPKCPIPGTDAAGVVEAVGAKVTRFAVGDKVFGECVRGHQWKNAGTFAEYVAAPERRLEPKPDTLTYEQAGAMPTSALIALQAVHDEARVEAGQSVLVIGAAGGVGSYAVQLAVARGAIVTGVDAPDKLEMVRSLGATDVVDYTTQDVAALDERFDAIIDVASSQPFSQLRHVLTPTGAYVLIGHDHYGAKSAWLGSMGTFFKLLIRSPFSKQLNVTRAGATKEPMREIAELAAAGKLTTVIDSTFRLEQAPDALLRLMSGEACGKIVIVP